MILLTGATGFLGGRLLETLISNGHEVVAIKRSFSDTSRIEKLLNHDRLHVFNIDQVEPKKIFDQYPIDTIIHTATEYGRNETPVFRILEANLILPLRLAEIGIENGVKCFINTDSYFNKDHHSYSHLLNYSLSKKSLLIWLKQLSKRLKIINVVLEHLYGPYDSKSKFVENLIQQIAVKKVERIPLTHGHQKRDFIYLDDVVSAYLKAIDYGRSHEFTFKTLEVGTGQSVQVRDFAETIKAISNSPTVLGYGDMDYRADEIMDSKADISQLHELGWAPTTQMRDGIVKILAAYGVNNGQ
jgi:CDP-paratose synthetase